MTPYAFRPSGLTAALSASNVSTVTPIQVPSSSGEPATQVYMFTNSGTVPAYLAVSNDPNPVAVAPVAGTPSNGIPLLPSSTQPFTFSSKAYFAVITASGTTTIYITPGEGI